MEGEIKKKKPPSINQGFFLELEFKVFFRTVNQAGFSGIFGCFSDIGYSKIANARHVPKSITPQSSFVDLRKCA
jgi:hypothetical protein